MKKFTFQISILLFFICASSFGQKVFYKDKYYTLKNDKIFQRGKIVTKGLNNAQRDSIYTIARELYDERGKLKPKYKKRKVKERYKAPEKFWQDRAEKLAQTISSGIVQPAVAGSKKATTTNVNNEVVAEAEENLAEKTQEEKSKEVVQVETEEDKTKEQEKRAKQEAVTQNKIAEKKQKEVENSTEELQDKEKTEQKKQRRIEEKKAREESKRKEEKQIETKRSTKNNKIEKDALREVEQKKKHTKVSKYKKESEHKENKNKREQKKKEDKLVHKKAEKQQHTKTKKHTTKKSNSKQQNSKDKKKKDKNSINKQKNKEERNNEKKEKRIYKTEKEQQKQVKQNKKQAKQIRKAKKEQEKQTKEVNKKAKQLKKKEKALKNLENATATLATTEASTEKDNFETIYFKINKEKTVANEYGDIKLYFDLINDSNKTLTILNKFNALDNRIDFFSTTMECEDIPITEVDHEPKYIKVKEDDYITVLPNSKYEFFIHGMYDDYLSCMSDDVVIKIVYNPFKSAEEGFQYAEPLQKDFKKVFNKITKIKIESENIKFKLRKQ